MFFSKGVRTVRDDPVMKLSEKSGRSVRELFELCYHNPDVSFDNFQGYIFDQDIPMEMETWCRQQLVALKLKEAA